MEDWWERWQVTLYASAVCILCVSMMIATHDWGKWLWLGVAILWAVNTVAEAIKALEQP